MDKPKILSGHELVARGTTKIDGSLPEIGLKDVIPNGSWLEQKQIQSALEARKHLIAVERIEKCGALSHAEWREELMLAEVTQMCGGHWQYLGHNVGKQLFLNPEEALFLIEVNCLQLKHNDVTVSLQQAYSLLLRDKITLFKYKVYASLSRLGYKVFRHDKKLSEKKVKESCSSDNVIDKNNDKPEENGDRREIKDVASTMEIDVKCEEHGCTKEVKNVASTMELNNKCEENCGTMEVQEVFSTMEMDDECQENGDRRGIKDVASTMEIDVKCEEHGCTKEVKEIASTMELNDKCEENCGTMEVKEVFSTMEMDDECQENGDTKEIEEVASTIDIHDKCEENGNTKEIEEVACTIDINDKCDTKEIKEFTSIMEIVEDTANKQTDINNFKSERNVTSQEETSDAECSNENITNSGSECKSNSQEVVSNKGCSANNSKNETDLVIIETDTENFVTEEHTDVNANDNEACDSVNPKQSDNEKLDHTNTMETEVVEATDSKEDCIIISVSETRTEINKVASSSCYPVNHHSKLQILEGRKLKPCNSKDLQKNFEIVPEMSQKHVVTVKVPEEKYIPTNVFLNSTTYVLNIENIKSKVNDIPTPSGSRTYSIPEEVSGAHVRRVRDANQGTPNRSVNNWSQPFSPNTSFPGQNQFRPYNYWRPRTNMNFIQFNLLFQRPFMPNMNFIPRLPLLPRPPPLIQFANPNFNANSENQNVPNNRKRMRDNAKQYHFEAIKRLAIRLKHLLQMGNIQTQNIVALQRLVQTYNTRYRMNLSLTNELDIIEREIIVETIDLDDEEESASKKPRTQAPSKYEENFNQLKQLALKLKDLDAKHKANARHRRAFSNLVKKFNKSYNADVTMTDYEVYDRRYISLDTSSDSDCIVEEPATKQTTSNKTDKQSGKKLRNPFNILKSLSEKHNSSISKPTTSKETKVDEAIKDTEDKTYSQFIITTFKNWLPNQDDFGRAEVPPKNNMYNYLIESKREEFLYEFIKQQQYNFDNWLETKASFLRSIAETTAFVQSEVTAEDRSELNSIIGPGDCTDMPSILSKLSIIPGYKQVDNETSLCIDFDVYNRNVQNFRKTSPPKPHFRVICLNECSMFPTGNDVAALHAQYEDNVVVMFAIVSLGSVSYLQVNPTNLPIYIPSNDFT